MSFDITNPTKPKIDKDPDAILDYSIDLTNWLAVGDSISALTVISDGVTINNQEINGNIVTAWLSGGTIGTTATATFRFTTVNGRTDDRTIYLKIKER